MQILFTLWLCILIPAPDLKYVVTKYFTAFHAIYDVATANSRRFSFAAEGRLAKRNVCGSQVICDAIYRKLAIICPGPGLNNFVGGFRRAYKPGEGDGLITNRSKKKYFKPSYIAVLSKILFEFDRFFNLPNFVRSRIHFNTCWGEGGCIFFVFYR